MSAAKRIFVGLLMAALIAIVLWSFRPETKAYPVSDGFRRFIFYHSIDEASKIPAEPSWAAVRQFFANASNFTIAFDGSSEQDNGIFAKAGFNLVSRIRLYYVDRGIQKGFSSSSVSDLGNATKVVLFLGPNTGATENAVKVVGNQLIIEGASKEGFETAVDAVSYAVFGLLSGPQAHPSVQSP